MSEKSKGRRVTEGELDGEDAEFTEAMATFDASGAWPALSSKALSEKQQAGEPGRAADRPRRRPPPEPERLDLHGDSIAEALARLEPFLVRVAARDQRRVIVITGQGRRSPGGVSVLRQKVGAWLRREASPWVREVETAPRELGGDGAWLVHLRRPRPR